MAQLYLQAAKTRSKKPWELAPMALIQNPTVSRIIKGLAGSHNPDSRSPSSDRRRLCCPSYHRQNPEAHGALPC